MLIETLTSEEARVLGTLIEKSLATPDYYPMTLNALRTACNQKSSREPVTEYDEDTVELALAGLKRKCLVVFIPYGSSGAYKYRHFLEDVRFNADKPALAVVAVLLLRGGQTLNEIRTRASSLHPFASPEAAEAVLQGLARRSEPWAELLPKRPGWKEARWRDVLQAHNEEASAPADEAHAGATTVAPSKWEAFEELRREVAELKEAYAALKSEVAKIRSELGG
ncbi:MAG: DUF480 domain-containing protein [Fibrobacteres bacterium]|nr:DUF480 domain-containing protein [Fibrobacterota bacterium]